MKPGVRAGFVNVSRGPFAAFAFATRTDQIFVAVATLLQVVQGSIGPLNALVLGEAVEQIGSGNADGLHKVAIHFAILAVVGFVISGVSSWLFEFAAEKQIARLKRSYHHAVLKQEIGFYDMVDSGTLATDLEQSCVRIRDGLGFKFGMIFFCLSSFIVGYFIALSNSWELSLVMSVTTPLSVVALVWFEQVLLIMNERSMKAYKVAGAVAEEAIPAIRTIASFGLERFFTRRFNTRLKKAEDIDIRANTYLAFVGALMDATPFVSYAVGLWYGARLVRRAMIDSGGTETSMGGIVMTVFTCILSSSQSLGMLMPYINGMARASNSVKSIVDLCDRASQIDPFDEAGETRDHIKGKIHFRDVRFSYPSRQHRPIYAGVNFEIEPGETVALVGPSGCGKSTTIQLLERFYLPNEGSVEIDGLDISKYSLPWLRSQMALVAQEPRLFCDTVENNIKCGFVGDPRLVSRDEVIRVAKLANAHSFIAALPNGYDTNVGQGGSLLSGGQKQRVAIARAILRDPPILILDEATSALDNESERIVQQALDDLLRLKKRTTIIIAHRLTTIRQANKIVVFDNPQGRGSTVIEMGSHADLMKLDNGVYRSLVEAQTIISTGNVEQKQALEKSLVVAGAISGLAPSVDKDPHHGPPSPGIPLLTQTSAAVSRILPTLSHEVREDKPGPETPLPIQAEKAPLRDIRLEILESSKIRRLFTYMTESWPMMIFGTIGSLFTGVSFPLISLLTAFFMHIFYDADPNLSPEANGDLVVYRAKEYTYQLLSIAGVASLFMYMQWEGWGRAGERLVYSLRRRLFDTMMHSDMEFFDNPLHNTGRLSSVLSADCGLTRGVTGANLAIMSQNLSTLVVAVTVAFMGHPRLAAVSTVAYLLIVPTLFLQMRYTQAVRTSMAETGAKQHTPEFIFNETITNLRTIAAYGLQQRMINLYDDALHVEMRRGLRNANVIGLATALSGSLMSAANSISFHYVYILKQSDPDLNLQIILQVVFVMMTAGTRIASAASYSTDIRKAKAACINIYSVLERESLQDVRDLTGDSTSLLTGKADFNEIIFRYPTRPNNPILGGATFKIAAGQAVALVGASGSGKSTIIQLIERFYDIRASDRMRLAVRSGQETQLSNAHWPLDRLPSAVDYFSGEILLDGKPIQEYQLKHLRRQMGLVGQEPVLFDMSIEENIRRGKEGATLEEVIEAARKANAHEFIESLPDGYRTEVGKGGGQMSGGQKQRLAIARALVRDPRILLLDEATSALDPENEATVQKTIDKLLSDSKAKGERKTSITIAHRLSTVQNADKIVVFAPTPNVGSRVVEEGTHHELMQIKGGVYRNLIEISQSAAATED